MLRYILIGVAVLFLLGYLGSQRDGGSGEPGSEGFTREAAKPAPKPRPPAKANIRIEARASRCLAIASEARIYVFMALRNYSNRKGSIDILPVRRYNDGSTNDSFIDVVTAKLGPRDRRIFRASFDYDALEHDLVECWLRRIDTGKQVRVSAEQSF